MNILMKSAGFGLLAAMLFASTGSLAGGIKITFPKEMVEAAQNHSLDETPLIEELPTRKPVVLDLNNPFPGVGKPFVDSSAIDPNDLKFLLPGTKLDPGGSIGKSGALSKNDAKLVVCVVVGSPAELMVVNRSNVTLPEGTAIRWQVRQFGRKGYVALNADLSAGQGFTAKGMLEDGIGAGADCSAKIM